MPRVRRRTKYRSDYSAQEKQTLLTGVPVSCASTRFNHPFAKGGWNVDEIRLAWELLESELRELWEDSSFDAYRDRGIFAERFLSKHEGGKS